MKVYDLIIIGAGSVGVPTAFFCSKLGLKVLVIDSLSSVGQGQNKAAIGGVRATHSDIAKITLGKRSLQIFSTWQQNYGDEIGYKQGGYCFPAYTIEQEQNFKSILTTQKKFGLNIEWLDKEELLDQVKGLEPEGLLGGTLSKDDCSVSPLKFINSVYKHTKADFKFNERVIEIILKDNKIQGVRTDKDIYYTDTLINSAGAYANYIGKLMGIELAVIPDAHEAGITEPVKQFLGPMIVDTRSFNDSKNFYFYQNKEGQIVFCLTPNPLIPGYDTGNTSTFLTLAAERFKKLFKTALNLRVRRIWRGLYPMTSTGVPIVGKSKEIQGLINAVGMCGQGFMLGPAIGELISKLISDNLSELDKTVLNSLCGEHNSCEIFL